MKTTAIYFAIAMSLLLIDCNKDEPLYDTEATVMVDDTDPLPVYPTAKAILTSFKLKENPWQGIEIKLVAITSNDINDTKYISLEKESKLTGNNIVRRAKVQRFTEQLQSYLTSLDSVRHLPHSIIYRSIAKEAVLLTRSKIKTKLLIVYSDLLENSEISFYNPQTFGLLQKDPALVEKQLEAYQPLPSLDGVQVWFLYAPNSYHQNNVFMPIARFYESVYIAHHATVHIANQFSPQ